MLYRHLVQYTSEGSREGDIFFFFFRSTVVGDHAERRGEQYFKLRMRDRACVTMHCSLRFMVAGVVAGVVEGAGVGGFGVGGRSGGENGVGADGGMCMFVVVVTVVVVVVRRGGGGTSSGAGGGWVGVVMMVFVVVLMVLMVALLFLPFLPSRLPCFLPALASPRT